MTGLPRVLPAPRIMEERGERWPAAGVTVVDGPGAAQMLRLLWPEPPALAHEEAYLLAVGSVDGRPVAAVVAAGERGRFYARQTLGQLEVDGQLPGVRIADWPSMDIRGTIEGFYGPPWSHAERLAHLDFLGRYKLNTYVYAPKDDPYHREQWRMPYPPDKLAHLGEVVRRAAENEVTLVFAIHPGRSVVFTSESDFAALTAKAEAVRVLGVRQFALLLDDIDPELRDPGDIERFGRDYAAAQVHLCNRFARYLREKDPAHRLLVCPTEYWQEGSTPYRETLGAGLDPEIRLFWTGLGVAAAQVTREQTADMHQIYHRHDLVLWDNYPVNDYNRHRLNMGYLGAREPGLPGAGQVGLVANPMNEARASRVPLITAAAFAWNDVAYRPEADWVEANLREGGQPLRFFSDHCRAFKWAPEEAPALAEAIHSGDLQAEAHFRAMTALRGAFDPAGPLGSELAPYLHKLYALGQAGLAAVALRRALAAGQCEADIWAGRCEADQTLGAAQVLRHQIGGGRTERFATEAIADADRRLGLVGAPTATAIPVLPPAQPMTNLRSVDGADPAWMLDWRSDKCYKVCRHDAEGRPLQPRIEPGDWIGLDLGCVRSLDAVRLVMNGPVEWSGPMKAAVLEASPDGERWAELALLEGCEEFEGAFPGVAARYVRLRATAPQEKTLWVRHFVVAGEAGVQTAGAVPAGATATWTLAPAQSPARIVLMQNPDYPLLSGAFEVTADSGAEHWTAVGSLTGACTTASWNGPPLHGVRIVAHSCPGPAQVPLLGLIPR